MTEHENPSADFSDSAHFCPSISGRDYIRSEL